MPATWNRHRITRAAQRIVVRVDAVATRAEIVGAALIGGNAR
jgi:hypothetical protein